MGDDVKDIVVQWVDYMKTELLMGSDDPLFPEPNMGQKKDQSCVLSLGLHYIDGDCPHRE